MYDEALGLIWTEVIVKKVTFESAEEACEDRGAQFRLPTLQELASIIQSDRAEGGYMTKDLSPYNEVWLWAKSPIAVEGQEVSIDFSSAQVYLEYYKNLRAYRCVKETSRSQP